MRFRYELQSCGNSWPPRPGLSLRPAFPRRGDVPENLGFKVLRSLRSRSRSAVSASCAVLTWEIASVSSGELFWAGLLGRLPSNSRFRSALGGLLAMPRSLRLRFACHLDRLELLSWSFITLVSASCAAINWDTSPVISGEGFPAELLLGILPSNLKFRSILGRFIGHAKVAQIEIRLPPEPVGVISLVFHNASSHPFDD